MCSKNTNHQGCQDHGQKFRLQQAFWKQHGESIDQKKKKKNWKWETSEETGIRQITDKTSDNEAQNQVSKNEVWEDGRIWWIARKVIQ